MVLGETVTATVQRRSQGNLGRAASACMQARGGFLRFILEDYFDGESLDLCWPEHLDVVFIPRLFHPGRWQTALGLLNLSGAF